MAYLQIQMIESISLMLLDSSAPLVFPALEFIPAIAAAVNSGEAHITALQPQITFTIQAVQSGSSIQIRFINEAESTYVWEDDAILLASDNPSVREQVLRSHRFWFDCDNSTFESAIGEIVTITNLRRRIDLVNGWRCQSAAIFYLSFEQKLHHDRAFTIDELIPPSGAGLLRHFHLEQCAAESLSFHEKLSRAAESLLAAEGLEICLERLSCLPVKLPTLVREAFSKLPSSQKQALLDRLTSRLASPVCKLHLIDLALLSPDSTDLVQSTLDELFGEVGEIQFRLFNAILNLLGSKFSYWSETRKWIPSIRLGMIWVHTSKMYNLLYHPTVNLEEFSQGLEEHTKLSSISADIIDRNPEFWNDVLHPRRLNRMALVVHGLAAIVAEQDPEILKAMGIADKIAAFAVRTVGEQQFLNPALWHDDSTLAQDNLESILGGDRSKYLASLLGTELGHQVSSEQLKAVVESAINTLANEPLAKNKWLSIIAIIGDLPIYSDLVDQLSSLVNNIDIFELYKAGPSAALYALMVAADHAANTSDENLRSKLEQELVAIAGLINFQEQTEQVDSEIADHVLESALKLAIRANDPRTTSHSLNSLLAKISHTWSRFAGRRAVGLSRTVQELPANQLHGAWTTVLLLRALRNK